jgi:hypothetical protein
VVRASAGNTPGFVEVLVVCEVALACILLVGARLLIRSFPRVLDVNIGFQAERAAALRVDPSLQYSTQAQRNAYFDGALRRVCSLPSIQAAGLTDAVPLGSNQTWNAGTKETLARTLWPGRNPIGQTVTYVDVDRQVIGVVTDVN